jgi:RNA polymerase sigma-70 factor, ECF subfamily
LETNFQRIAQRLQLYDSVGGQNDHEEIVADDYAAQLEEIHLEPTLAANGTTVDKAVQHVAHEDTGLVHRIQWGDMAAFEALFNKYQSQIYRTAYAITRDAGAAEEVLQDCFYKTYLNIMNITGEGSLSPWLHRVAVNLSCNALKKRRVHLEPIDDVAEGYITAEAHQSPEAMAEQSELRVRMRDAINALPLKHRVVVTLHYLQDFSLPEIAFILEVPVGTVKSRLHHARKALRDQLESQQATQIGATYDPAY